MTEERKRANCITRGLLHAPSINLKVSDIWVHVITLGQVEIKVVLPSFVGVNTRAGRLKLKLCNFESYFNF